MTGVYVPPHVVLMSARVNHTACITQVTLEFINDTSSVSKHYNSMYGKVPDDLLRQTCKMSVRGMRTATQNGRGW